VRFLLGKEPIMATATKQAMREDSRVEDCEKQRPVWKKSSFRVSVAVFRFDNLNAPPTFRVKLSTSFKRDKNAKREYSDYLFGSDLLRAKKLLDEADSFVQAELEAYYRSLREEEREASVR
jgi:hypothetical protein